MTEDEAMANVAADRPGAASAAPFGEHSIQTEPVRRTIWRFDSASAPHVWLGAKPGKLASDLTA